MLLPVPGRVVGINLLKQPVAQTKQAKPKAGPINPCETLFASPISFCALYSGVRALIIGYILMYTELVKPRWPELRLTPST